MRYNYDFFFCFIFSFTKSRKEWLGAHASAFGFGCGNIAKDKWTHFKKKKRKKLMSDLCVLILIRLMSVFLWMLTSSFVRDP